MPALSDIYTLLVLSRLRGLGAVALTILDEQDISPHELIDKPSLLRTYCPELGAEACHRLASGELLGEVDRIWSHCQRLGIEVIGWSESRYPNLLRQCPDAPLVLYARGDISCCQERETLSIVGTRRCTPYGQAMVRHLVQGLSAAHSPMTIVSGLALGIDIAAHRVAMEVGLPTVAVLAGGLDRIYPPAHRSDAIAMLERGGAWLSETPPHTPIVSSDFLRRNRLIAGLSSGTLVVEAGLRSGAMSTARMALAYDRSLFAVPGRAVDPESAGCNSLLATPCAILTTNATTIIEEMRLDG